MQNPTVTDFLRKVNVDEDLMPAYRAVFRKKMPLIAARFFRWASNNGIGPRDLSEVHLAAFLVEGRALGVPPVVLAVIEMAVRIQANRFQGERRTSLALISPACRPEIHDLISEAFGPLMPALLLALGATPPPPAPPSGGVRISHPLGETISREDPVSAPRKRAWQKRRRGSSSSRGPAPSSTSEDSLDWLFETKTKSALHLSAPYRRVHEAIPQKLRHFSLRFLRYLTIIGVEPNDATNAHLKDFIRRASEAKLNHIVAIEQNIRHAAQALRDEGRSELSQISSNIPRPTPRVDQLKGMSDNLKADFNDVVAAFADPFGETSMRIRTDPASKTLFAMHAANPGYRPAKMKPMKSGAITALQNQFLTALQAAKDAGKDLSCVLDLYRRDVWALVLPRLGPVDEPNILRSKVLERGRMIATWRQRHDLKRYINGQLTTLPKRRGGMSEQHENRLDAFTDEQLEKVVLWAMDSIEAISKGVGDLHSFHVGLAVFLFLHPRLTQPQLFALSFGGPPNQSGRNVLALGEQADIEKDLPPEVVDALDRAWPHIRLGLDERKLFWPVENPEKNTTCAAAIGKLGRKLGMDCLTIKVLQDALIDRDIMDCEHSSDSIADGAGITQLRNLDTRFGTRFQQAASLKENNKGRKA